MSAIVYNRREIPCFIMRGGTRKGILFHEKDVPPAGDERDKFLCAVMGSPDKRQIDGLGGADPLTSKIGIIAPANREDADVSYTFGQVSIDELMVDYQGNCGNITAAAALFAVQQGLVAVREPFTTIRIFNTNTGKVLRVDVPCKNGAAEECGSYRIDGVPKAGARIDIDFALTTGASSGRLLPTGKVQDVLSIPGIGEITCSIVDIANPLVFVKAADLGLEGRETPEEIESRAQVKDRLEAIRGIAAEYLGLVADWRLAAAKSPAMPMVAFVAAPGPDEGQVHIISRMMFMQTMHKTYSATAAVCTAVAAKIPGTVPFACARNTEEEFFIGHPMGYIGVDAKVIVDKTDILVERAAVGRTGRLLMTGNVSVYFG